MIRAFVYTSRNKDTERNRELVSVYFGSAIRKILTIAQPIAMSLSMLWKARSQKLNFFNVGMSLYLYAAGAKKNVISMMNHLGLSSSYSALMRHLLALMKSQMTSITGIARLRRILIIFDNINFANKIVEQRTGKTGTYHA